MGRNSVQVTVRGGAPGKGGGVLFNGALNGTEVRAEGERERGYRSRAQEGRQTPLGIQCITYNMEVQRTSGVWHS